MQVGRRLLRVPNDVELPRQRDCLRMTAASYTQHGVPCSRAIAASWVYDSGARYLISVLKPVMLAPWPPPQTSMPPMTAMRFLVLVM